MGHAARCMRPGVWGLVHGAWAWALHGKVEIALHGVLPWQCGSVELHLCPVYAMSWSVGPASAWVRAWGKAKPSNTGSLGHGAASRSARRRHATCWSPTCRRVACRRATCRVPHAQVEVYADPSARGGVLEPDAVCEIKFRTPDLVAMMHRCAAWWCGNDTFYLQSRWGAGCQRNSTMGSRRCQQITADDRTIVCRSSHGEARARRCETFRAT